MRTFWKATLAALSFTAFIGAASAQPYGAGDDGYTNNGYANNGYANNGYANNGYANNGYANNGYGDPYGGGSGDPYAGDDSGIGVPQDGIPYDQASGGYCDQWGCPDDYYDLPVYYGSAFYDGLWFDGPLYYRNWYGSRQYWVHGGWHADNWRGARPSWYAQGRYGPALGRDFYRSGSFRSGNAQRSFNRGFDNRGAFNGNSGNASRPSNGGFGNRSFDNRQSVNAGNGMRFGNRGFAAPAASQVQDRGARSQGQGFQRSDAGRQDRSANRGNFQRSSAARPQVQHGDGGGHGGNHGGGHGRSR
jgi:hypothetical protein